MGQSCTTCVIGEEKSQKFQIDDIIPPSTATGKL